MAIRADVSKYLTGRCHYLAVTHAVQDINLEELNERCLALVDQLSRKHQPPYAGLPLGTYQKRFLFGEAARHYAQFMRAIDDKER